MITQDSIERLKNDVDIVEIIGQYIELRKAGANYKALCPFHHEKTGSFMVSPQKQIFHCFGCGEGGDTISFIKKIDNLSYPEAIEKLASLVNFTLEYEKRSNAYEQKSIIYILEKIKEHYRRNYIYQQNANEYLKKRGVQQKFIEYFEIGYAKDNFNTLDFLKKEGITKSNAFEAGVLSKIEENSNNTNSTENTNKYNSRQIERLIFPIHSPKGTIIGFGGRTLSQNHPVKYINSPATKLFNKSRVLYGYHNAKKSIYEKKRIIITEGYLDTIMLHQANFGESVATLGTSITKDHLPLISKGSPEVIIAYDGDRAGVSAALRASEMLIGANKQGGVVIFEGGYDPCDMVANDKIEALTKLISNPKPFGRFLLEKSIEGLDISIPEQKDKALQAMLKVFKKLPLILQEGYKGFCANLLQIPQTLIRISHTTNQISTQPTKNIAEALIIKSIIAHEHIKDFVLNDIKNDIKDIFEDYQEEISLIQQGAMNDPKLLHVEFDGEIKPISNKDEIQKQITILMILNLQKAIKSLRADKSLPQKEVIYKIKDMQYKIEMLKKERLN